MNRSPGRLYPVISENLKVVKREKVELTKNSFLANIQFTHIVTSRQMSSMENFTMEMMKF